MHTYMQYGSVAKKNTFRVTGGREIIRSVHIEVGESIMLEKETAERGPHVFVWKWPFF